MFSEAEYQALEEAINEVHLDVPNLSAQFTRSELYKMLDAGIRELHHFKMVTEADLLGLGLLPMRVWSLRPGELCLPLPCLRSDCMTCLRSASDMVLPPH